MVWFSMLVPRFLACGCALLLLSVSSVILNAATNGGYRVNITNRADVRALYTNVYLSSVGVPLETSAFSEGPCYAGTNSTQFKEASLRRLNYFRALAGVSANVVIDSGFEFNFQSAALITHRNGINHSPPQSSLCWSAAGAAACGQANLAYGIIGPAAMDFYILNAEVPTAGHRRWLLNPPMAFTAFGDVGAANATSAFNASGSDTSRRDNFVSWPPPGYVPFQHVSKWWSFSYPGGNFSGTTITIHSNGVPVPVTKRALAPGYGLPTVVWTVDSMTGNHIAPTNDVIYTVTLQNAVLDGVTTNVTYQIMVFDPAQDGALPDPQPILGIGWYAGLSVTGIVGRTYRIEYVTNINETNDWKTAGAVRLTNNPTLWFDPESDRATRRYYRALSISSP